MPLVPATAPPPAGAPSPPDGAPATVTSLLDSRRPTAGRPSPPRERAGSSPPPPDADAARDAIAWLVRATHEVAAGVRPFPQLLPWLAPSVARRLGAQLRRSRSRPDARLTIRRVHLGTPTPSGALEATAVIEHDGRVRAVAVRLERHRERWRATELTAPEAGYAPLATASSPAREDGPDAFDLAAAEEAARDRLQRATAACGPPGPDAVVIPLSSRRGSA